MQHVYRTLIGATAVLMAGALGVAAQDRSAPPMTPGGAMPMMQGMSQGGMMGMMPMMEMMSMMPMMGMADHIEGRIAFLKTELKITDAQLPQWNNFADALRSNARRMTEMRGAMMQGGMMQGGTMQGGMMGQTNTPRAPERVDRMEKMMTGMLESVRATKAALGPLYEVLSEEQKKTADALLRGPMGMMGRM
jgi:LTXXQ motif family protein